VTSRGRLRRGAKEHKMGHSHSKGRSGRRRTQTRTQTGRPKIEHLTFQHTKQHINPRVNEPRPNQYCAENYSSKPSKPRPIRTSKTRTSNYQPFWRDPSPTGNRQETDEENKAGNRTKERHYHGVEDYDGNANRLANLPVKRNAKSLSPNRLNQHEGFGPPRKLKDMAGIPMSKSAPDHVVEQRGRSPGRVFCLVRCRSEPTNPTAQMEPFQLRRNQRKAASASPPRKISRSGESHDPNGHGNTIYHNDEIAISFEQVEPQTYRVVGGKTTLGPGPVPKTNRIAPRPLRRTFPQMQPKISQRLNTKTVSDTKLQIRSAKVSRFTQPPIPPRKHRLRDLSHLVKDDFEPLPAPKIRDPTCYVSPERSPFRSPSRTPPAAVKNSYVGGSIETIESISTQSGSYHLPSSAHYTPNDRSLIDSPYGFDELYEPDEDSFSKMHSFEDNVRADELTEGKFRGRNRTKPERFRIESEPRPFDPGGIGSPAFPDGIGGLSEQCRPSRSENTRRSLLWSNPAPFGTHRNSNVIRHVEPPKPKTKDPLAPVQKFSPAGRFSVDSDKFRNVDKQRSPTRRSDQSPDHSKYQKKSVYKDVFDSLQQVEDASKVRMECFPGEILI